MDASGCTTRGMVDLVKEGVFDINVFKNSSPLFAI